MTLQLRHPRVNQIRDKFILLQNCIDSLDSNSDRPNGDPATDGVVAPVDIPPLANPILAN